MDRYRCTICGYIYDPSEGDLQAGIDPGTTFEELPKDFICPICAAGKEEFLYYG